MAPKSQQLGFKQEDYGRKTADGKHSETFAQYVRREFDFLGTTGAFGENLLHISLLFGNTYVARSPGGFRDVFTAGFSSNNGGIWDVLAKKKNTKK